MSYTVRNHTRGTTVSSMVIYHTNPGSIHNHTLVSVDLDVDNATATPQAIGYSNAAAASIAIILGIIVVLTITGNLLVIASVAINPHLRTTTYYFIANLAVADLLLGFAVLPFSATLEVLQYWVFGRIFCHIWAAFDVLCCTASILSLCVISIDRYIGVTRPLRHCRIMNQTRTMYVIISVWLVSEDDNPDPKVCTVTTHPSYVLFSVSGSFYIPCLVILIVYFRIYQETVKYTKCLMSGAKTFKVDEDNVVSLRIHLGRHVTQEFRRDNYHNNGTENRSEEYNTSPNGHKNSKRNSRLTFSNKVAKFKREKKAAKILGIVVGVFITCWLPFFVVLPVESLCQCYIPPALFKFFFWLGYCNSIMNPIIYTCSSTECRRAFIAILTCRRCRKRPRISLSELQMKGKVHKNGHRSAMRQLPQQVKEQDLHYPLCDISSSSSSPPGTFTNIPVGMELAAISLPQTVRHDDSVLENTPGALRDSRNAGIKTDSSSVCKTKSNLKKWISDNRVNFHQKFQKCSSVS
ncbi:unnamed protein product [Candidula unifasciata]|uniref:G-protein coupled receptors family 1 profile domain-containing protein n=1 Tax=Candidula unifasciata TaxID=100452 RepID=A0A8S3YNL2_9EUPU|nr:unnamed protein product [Candidula unifasciata]